MGKGYLNRPELTAERFVPNPFATEENRQYLAGYYTADTQIEDLIDSAEPSGYNFMAIQ